MRWWRIARVRRSSEWGSGSAASSRSRASKSCATIVDGPAGRREQHCEHASLDVVEGVAGLANEGVLVAGHAREHAELEQQPHDCDEVAALLASAQLERDARGARRSSPAATITPSARRPSVICASARSSTDSARQRST